MQLHTKVWEHEISKIKDDLIINKKSYLKFNMISKELINLISKDLKLEVYKIKESKDLVNILIDYNVVIDDNSLRINNKTIHSEVTVENVKELLKDLPILILSDSEYDLDNFQIINSDIDIIKDKINDILDPMILSQNLSYNENLLVYIEGNSQNSLNNIIRVRSGIYTNQYNQLSDLQKKVLKSRFLSNKITNKFVKDYVGNKNSSVIINSIQSLIKKNILLDENNFQDNFFKLWIVENFNSI